MGERRVTERYCDVLGRRSAELHVIEVTVRDLGAPGTNNPEAKTLLKERRELCLLARRRLMTFVQRGLSPTEAARRRIVKCSD